MQHCKKNLQIPKYSVKIHILLYINFMISHAYLKLYPSRVFDYLKHIQVYTSNQPQPLQENVRRARI